MGTILTKGEKIAFIAQSFYDDPMKLVNHYNTLYDDHTTPDRYGFDKTWREFYSSSVVDGMQISVGEYNNSYGHYRYRFQSFGHDIYSFSPSPDPEASPLLTVQDGIISKELFDLDDEMYSTEEGMFQCITVLSPFAYETLEVYLHLKKHCKVPFKMNLELFDLDEVVELYEKP